MTPADRPRDPEITIRDRPGSSRYEIHLDGAFAGHADYALLGDRMVFTHTEIDDRFEGHGLGGRLAGFALDDARARDLGVVPQCPFIASYIERHPAYADLVVAP